MWRVIFFALNTFSCELNSIKTNSSPNRTR